MLKLHVECSSTNPNNRIKLNTILANNYEQQNNNNNQQRNNGAKIQGRYQRALLVCNAGEWRYK